MKIGYFIRAHGQTIKDAVEIKEISAMMANCEQDLANLAHEAAEYAWINNDGWEWLRPGTILTLVIDEEEKGDYSIEIEVSPVFIVRKQKEEETK